MVFHKDAPENEKLVLKRSILGLGRVMYFDVAELCMLRETDRQTRRDTERQWQKKKKKKKKKQQQWKDWWKAGWTQKKIPDR